VIYLTSAPNDQDLIPHIPSVIPCPIPYGDAIFQGYWTDNEIVWSCVERKKLLDMLKCLDDGRHIDQVGRAREAGFEWYVTVLEIPEGYMREALDGIIEYRNERGWWTSTGHTYKRLDQYLNELSLYCGVLVKRTHTVRETARVITDLYELFQEPPEKHNSLLRFHRRPNAVNLQPPSLLRRMAKELEGVDWKRSGWIEEEFKEDGIRKMINAPKMRWLAIKGIGKVITESVDRELGPR